MIHAGLVEQLRDYGHLVKVVNEEPGMTGNSACPSAVVIDHDHGLVPAGVDIFRPPLALR